MLKFDTTPTPGIFYKSILVSSASFTYTFNTNVITDTDYNRCPNIIYHGLSSSKTAIDQTKVAKFNYEFMQDKVVTFP